MKTTLLFLLALAGASAADYDILIRNARVIDGTGNPWYRADVGIRDGRIAAIGRLTGEAGRVIDARDRVVTPGFIDVHTHIEGEVEKVPRADNFLYDGVTTVVTGNCGGSRENLAAWFAALEKAGFGINVASLIGHNTVRRQVLGGANRTATAEETARMQALVEQAMRDGAAGFSTGLIYVPGTYADTGEVVALARAAAKYNGVYASHMRDEGERVVEAIAEAVRVGSETGMHVQLSHFKIDNKRLWGMSEKTLALVEDYRAQGVDVTVDQYPFDWSSTSLSIRLPSWALADGPEKVRERLTDAGTKAEVAAQMKRDVANRGREDYAWAMVASCKANPEYEGRTITEINRMKGRAPGLDNEIETIFDMMLAGGAGMVYQSMGMADVERILRHPFTAVASDGGVREMGVGKPHPRSYATNARVLAEYVRKRRLLTLEEAVRRMTTLPANSFHFTDRGVLRPGAAADVLLFDPARIQDKATYVEPHQYSEGIDAIIVNGRLVAEDGKLNDVRAGRVLRRQ